MFLSEAWLLFGFLLQLARNRTQALTVGVKCDLLSARQSPLTNDR
jgi:hypothetical protein